ncbi:hypothetical protein PAESOLCIP111_01970 [Paenibacillus solanacearum]|uniref:YqbQ/XkdQ domain-containing protein n=1 Tax=Paenibacillus solanacearum TaxID=2048548 RepID=A0A916K2D1_9BACL|nr:hypothetical protein [Paenibacillus solanacearum]CAG7617010.1 hypothetical protein PAESOLCIP111_01970 [Paenibacillus solanacearum]
MLTIIIDNKDGMMWDISGIVPEASYKTSRIGKASTFEFKLVHGGLYQSADFKINVGDIVRVRHNETNLFYGFIFTIEEGRGEEVSVSAYDQLRYLQANESYQFFDMTATDMIRLIAKDFELNVGTLDDTGYKIPAMIEDNKKLFDIICKALTFTLQSTGRNYVLFDNFGELTLRNIEELTLDCSLGDMSLLYDYKHKRSIEDAYNVVKLVQENKEKQLHREYVLMNSNNIRKWGKLQYFQIIDEKLNTAQVNEKLETTMRLRNREKRSFHMDALGDSRVRAGFYVSVNISELGLDQFFLVNECKHKFDGMDHTMSLELIGVFQGGFTGDY